MKIGVRYVKFYVGLDIKFTYRFDMNVLYV